MSIQPLYTAPSESGAPSHPWLTTWIPSSVWQLRAKMGAAFSVCLGNPTGHYLLDLAVTNDRSTLNKLGRVNNFEKNVTRLSNHPSLNTSQRGNGENFRYQTSAIEARRLYGAPSH
jgi:hypothetical protein